MRRPRILLLLLFLGGSHLATGQDVFQFLRNDVSPRVAALGGAFASMQGDPNSLFVNPGALTTIPDRRFSVSYLDHLLDISAGSVALTLPETPLGMISVGVLFLHYGSFERTDQASNAYGSFTASDLAFSVGTAVTVEEYLSIGGAIKFIHSSLGDFRSEAVAADIGAFYLIPEERISIGVSLLHLGSQLSTYAGSRESLPTDLRVGITKRPEHLPVLININLHGLNESDRPFGDRLKQFSFGAEFEMSTSFRLRLGFNNRIRQDVRLGSSAGLAGFSVGTGIEIGSYRLDYAFNSYGAIGGLHRLGISSDF